MKKETDRRSKYWDKLVEILDREFPKRQSKERGRALVLLAYAEMALLKMEEEKQELLEKKEEGIKEFGNWLEKEDRQNWEIERYVESLLEEEKEKQTDKEATEDWIETELLCLQDSIERIKQVLKN